MLEAADELHNGTMAILSMLQSHETELGREGDMRPTMVLLRLYL